MPSGMSIKLRVIPAGALQTNAYLISDTDRKEAALIDAPDGVMEFVGPALEEDGCALTDLLLTHGHYDHIGDAAKIAKKGATVYGHAADKSLFESPQGMQAWVYPPELVLEGFAVNKWVEEGERLEVLGMACEVRHVPGHCPGNVLFYFPDAAIAFVGDALFAGGIGRTDLPGGAFSELENSIRTRIYTLPEETKVLPGHGPQTSVGEEKLHNPFVSEQ